MASTLTPLDSALSDLMMAESKTNGIARGIADLILTGQAVPPEVCVMYKDATNDLTAAESRYVAAFDEIADAS